MKKLKLTIFSVLGAFFLALGLILLTNVNTAHAENTAGTEPTLSATKVMLSKNNKKMLLVTAIIDHDDVFEIGYEFEGTFDENLLLSNETSVFYRKISDGKVERNAQSIFGDGYENAKMIVWEISHEIGDEHTFKAYAKVGDRNPSGALVETEKVVKNDSNTKQFAEITIATNNNAYGSINKSSLVVPVGTEVSDDDNVITIGGLTVTATPTANDAHYTYAFDSFTGAGETILGDTTITANFTQTVNQYNVVFQNYDGTTLQSGKVDYGTMPVYSGATPTRAATEEFAYAFDAWDKEIVAVTGDITYTATFVKMYPPVIVLGIDDSIYSRIGQEINIGATVTVAGETAGEATIVYSSSDDNIATVSNGGLITGVAAGTAIITLNCTYNDLSAIEQTITVKVVSGVISNTSITTGYNGVVMTKVDGVNYMGVANTTHLTSISDKAWYANEWHVAGLSDLRNAGYSYIALQIRFETQGVNGAKPWVWYLGDPISIDIGGNPSNTALKLYNVAHAETTLTDTTWNYYVFDLSASEQDYLGFFGMSGTEWYVGTIEAMTAAEYTAFQVKPEKVDIASNALVNTNITATSADNIGGRDDVTLLTSNNERWYNNTVALITTQFENAGYNTFSFDLYLTSVADLYFYYYDTNNTSTIVKGRVSDIDGIRLLDANGYETILAANTWLTVKVDLSKTTCIVLYVFKGDTSAMYFDNCYFENAVTPEKIYIASDVFVKTNITMTSADNIGGRDDVTLLTSNNAVWYNNFVVLNTTAFENAGYNTFSFDLYLTSGTDLYFYYYDTETPSSIANGTVSGIDGITLLDANGDETALAANTWLTVKVDLSKTESIVLYVFQHATSAMYFDNYCFE